VSDSADPVPQAGSHVAAVDLAQLDRRPLRVQITPGPSLFTIAADVAGAGRGSPSEWITAARAQLDASDLRILAPIGRSWGSFVPACVTPLNADAVTDDVAGELERIATLPEERFLEDLAFACGDPPEPPWDAVARRPRAWLVRYARALARVWDGVREPWLAAQPLFEREVERVSIAAERGALPELVAGLHHSAEVRDGAWRFTNDEPMALELPEDGLPIRPLLAGPGSARANLSDAGLLEVLSYPVPGAIRILKGDLQPPAQALENLLGAQRARVLRELDEPRHAGALAEALVATPGAATHHLNALEAAGLILRERSGRRVFVHRTARGSALLDLYDSP
jgi:DNA-binding transcriptional ArsR family regulator